MEAEATFGRWLKLRRRALGWTQAQLGAQIGYSGETVRKVEADELRPSLQLAERLAEALEIVPADRERFVRFARDQGLLESVALPAPGAVLPVPASASAPHPLHPPYPLPLPRDPLIGREHEVATLQRLILQPTTALVTLTGPGGVGKTRLALQVAANLSDHFSGGLIFVPLSAIDDPTLVLPTLAHTLNLREGDGEGLLALLKKRLQVEPALLILDNFEQVVSAGPLISDLLQAAPQLKVLVTSRLRLHLRTEQPFAVPPLALPQPPSATQAGAAQAATASDSLLLTPSAAVRLFVARAQALYPDFALRPDNAAAIAEVCRRLDGLPLAIELAAARILLLPPQAMVARLGQQLNFLAGGPRDLPQRQQTIRATLEWSHALLSTAEKCLFRRLAVFAGGATVAQVEAVCNGDGALPDPLASMASLLDQSLLLQKMDGEEPRVEMLRVIREYALERLAESGEGQRMRGAQTDYFLAWVEEVEPKLSGAQQQWWLERLESEHDNLRAVLEWSLADGDAAVALRLAAALWQFWQVRGYLSEGRRWLEEALVKLPEPAALRTKGLDRAGMLAWNQGDYATARAYHERCLAIERELGNKRGIAGSLGHLANVAKDQGDYAEARLLLTESLSIEREIGDLQGMANSLNNLGIIALDQGDYEAARTLLSESLAVERQLGNRRGMAMSLNNLGIIALNQGDFAAAHVLYEESLAIKQELGDKRGMAGSLNNLGEVAWNQGDFAAARALLEESLAIKRELGDKRSIAGSLNNLGLVAIEQGHYSVSYDLLAESLSLRREVGDKLGIAASLAGLAGIAQAYNQEEKRAARLLAAATSVLESIGGHLDALDRTIYEWTLKRVQELLGEEAFNAAWAEGRTMNLEQVVDFALRTIF